ncbi:MAG: choice-of-anchor D domain-containing protein, partial [Polyangia bacterium]
MTCSKRFGRLLQASCLGLIGTLTVVGCSGSSTTAVVPDGGADLHPTTEVGPGQGQGQATVSPITLTFGSVDVGATSTLAVTVTVTNGTLALAPAVTPASSGFTIASTTCAGAQPAGTCTVSVQFAPGQVGAANGTLTFGAATSASVALTGTGNTPGTFTVTPASEDLGTLQVNQTKTVTLTITPQPSVPSVTCTGSADLTATGTTCPATGAVSAACTVTFTFKAAAAGNASDTVTCTAGTKVIQTPVTANVVAPAQLVLTPSPVALNATVGASGTATVTVVNDGGSSTNALQASVAPAGPFTVTTDCGALASLALCHVQVTFSPTAAGNATATLTVTDGTVQGTDTLNGVAVASAAVAITPATSSFGNVVVGQPSKPTAFTLTNSGGTATGLLTLASGSPAFAVSSDLCSGTALAPKGTCTFSVTFTPSAAGAASANITATAAGALVAAVQVTGTGTPMQVAALTASPTSVNFGSVPVGQQSTATTVTITNSGGAASGALKATLSGTGVAQVAITGNSCTATLAAAATCTVALQYSPTDTTGVNGQLNVTDGTVSVNVPLSGTGLTPTVIQPYGNQANPVAFGNVVVGYSYGSSAAPYAQIAITEASSATTATGTITATLGGTNSTDFAVVASATTCTSLQPGQNCVIAVSFTPAAAGARTATLTVTSANGGNYQFTLNGTALATVQLIALGQTASTASTVYTGLNFGQTPNAVAGDVFAYRLVVRGATTASATSTVLSIPLAAGTPPDFTYVTPPANTAAGTLVAAGLWTAITTNPCAGTIALPVAPSGVKTPTNPSIAPDTTVSAGASDDQMTASYSTCDFYVQFDPQSGQSATAKTATLTATGSNGGTATLSLTGTATGPLTINPSTGTFAATPVGTADVSTNAQTFTVANVTGTSVSQGPLTVAVTGTNAADFSIVTDTCSTVTLAPSATCTISVGFAPSTAAAETASLTVTSASTS